MRLNLSNKMKLSKLYTNNSNFKSIKFNVGFNVIYADVKSKEDSKNSHNLGKTFLIDVIDFLLLKGASKKHKLFKPENKNLFNNYIFYLEILLNNKKYLTIKRSTKNNSKISFKLNENTTEDFIPPQNWDIEDLTFDKAKKQLSEYLNFDFFSDKPYDYRKAINYSLRKQGDYQDIYRLTKFKGKDIDWKPFMFDLLGFKGGLIEKKYKIDEKIKEIEKFITEDEKDFDIQKEQKDELVGQIQIKEIEKEKLSKEIDKFNFYYQDKENINKLVDNIEHEISELNTQAYNFEFEINKTKQSIKNKFAFDLTKIQKVFKETEIYFPDQLIKEYKDLLDFNNKITTERNKYLKETLSIKIDKLSKVNSKLKELNNQKIDLLSYIQDTDVFRKFKQYQKKVIEAESEIMSIRAKIDAIDIIGNKEKQIKIYENKLDEIIEKIKNEVSSTHKNEIYKNIRTAFAEYYKTILDEIAVLSLRLNNKNNIEFNEPKVQSKQNDKLTTQQGDGYTYGKLFCVCFDLALLSTYNNQSFFRFVYHDDVFANQDNRIKLKLLELTKGLCNDYDLQYIFTIIKDDVPYDSASKRIEFKKKEIVLELHDKDETGTLFGMKF